MIEPKRPKTCHSKGSSYIRGGRGHSSPPPSHCERNRRMRTNFFYYFGTIRLGRVNALAFGLAMMICALLLGLQAATKPAHADTTFTVDRSDDPDLDTTPAADDCTAAEANDCSLRGAITAA